MSMLNSVTRPMLYVGAATAVATTAVGLYGGDSLPTPLLLTTTLSGGFAALAAGTLALAHTSDTPRSIPISELVPNDVKIGAGIAVGVAIGSGIGLAAHLIFGKD